MKYVVHDNLNTMWHDDICCVCWLPNLERSERKLSKKKLLKYFSELKEINEFHILLLDNLSKIFSLRHYMGENNVTISLDDTRAIDVCVPEAVFMSIITAAKIQ